MGCKSSELFLLTLSPFLFLLLLPPSLSVTLSPLRLLHLLQSSSPHHRIPTTSLSNLVSWQVALNEGLAKEVNEASAFRVERSSHSLIMGNICITEGENR